MSEQNNAEEILSILKNMYQEMVKNKNCKICRFHTSLPAFQGMEVVNMDFCTKKMCNCPFYLSCNDNDFEVIK